ncbi:MAG: hypothetical protein LBL62_09020 [Planctomycetaceae bacterium]|nr:hypothetical protein [Planctomycetaceae bacterium]
MQSRLVILIHCPFRAKFWVYFTPPRCGGLLCNAPKGAGEKLAILLK